MTLLINENGMCMLHYDDEEMKKKDAVVVKGKGRVDMEKGGGKGEVKEEERIKMKWIGGIYITWETKNRNSSVGSRRFFIHSSNL